MDRCPVERAEPSRPDADTAAAQDSPGEAARAGVTLFVCVTCGARPDGGASAGEALFDAARAAGSPEIAIESVRCLANCKRALSAAVARADGWTYVFGDLDGSSAGDLLDGAQLLAEAADGLMPWRGRPERLKRGMVARIPPLFPSKDRS